MDNMSFYRSGNDIDNDTREPGGRPERDHPSVIPERTENVFPVSADELDLLPAPDEM